jgi:lipopolysaccharide/colanic/teichoic acid biosynthesis glycosyltransferase
MGKRLYKRMGKRLLDLGLTIPAFVFCAPILVLVALVVRFQQGAGVIFHQQRPGLHGVPFMLFKFRTMTEARDTNGHLLPDAQRLTPFGRFMRSTSLDELPEFINVLKGDMSLVGPRPLLLQYLPLYTPEQMRRHEVRPGITGWAQVHGRNVLSWEQKFTLDTWYVEHQSLWLDLKILAMTVWKVCRFGDINQPGHATAEYFQGASQASENITDLSS